MACMGIASGDVDRDGRLDFLVTNFRNEPNTLYLQQADALFVDGTRRSGLYSGSLPFVGWGAQFLDADLDGWEDLFISNGHVDRYPSAEGGYAMHPQFFRNVGGSFHELTSQQAGKSSAKAAIGRAATRLDWNRDGLPDLAVAQLESAYQLIENKSTSPKRWLSIRLVGWQNSRDSIGTTVAVEQKGAVITKQQTAGDGYMSSNEKLLIFGLGSHPQSVRIKTDWADSEPQHLDSTKLKRQYILVEGAGLFSAPY